MNDFIFHECRFFLQNTIVENINNTELVVKLLSSYDNLVQKRAEVDMQFLKSDADVRKDYIKLDIEHSKRIQTDHKIL
ncbi:hypothetical protein [Seleniivibrio woodruffii]|uniref:hypothetical protein n=1 Tax=Seleniivibrio woodruffii TaxID=1078050 RepID=UPI00240A4CFF|nr:hypothetical protein [Seleniivibrio woodruffii]